MPSILSKWNRRRLFRRAERKANAQARAWAEQLSAKERAEVLMTMARFRPLDCGLPMLRIGPAGDGGYVLPDDLHEIAAMFSPGVDATIGFDLEIARRGIPCFLADGTVGRPAGLLDNMRFDPMMIGEGPPDRFMSMARWVDQYAPGSGDLILQIDIEGAEYDVLPAMPAELLKRFRIISLEMHALDRMLLTEDRPKLARLLDVLQTHHAICSIQPNTVAPPVEVCGRLVPPLLELALLRKDRFQSVADATAVYPHPLGAPNEHYLPRRDYPAFW